MAILFSKSLDQGQSWSAPIQVNDTPANRRRFQSQIAVAPDGQHVTITFCDRRNDTGNNTLVDLSLAESFDGGDTWEPNLRVSEFSSDIRNGFLRTAGGVPYYSFGNYSGLAPSLDLNTPGVACRIDTRTGYPRAFTATIQRAQGPAFETLFK
jgi:hypothetical protein